MQQQQFPYRSKEYRHIDKEHKHEHEHEHAHEDSPMCKFGDKCYHLSGCGEHYIADHPGRSQDYHYVEKEHKHENGSSKWCNFGNACYHLPNKGDHRISDHPERQLSEQQCRYGCPLDLKEPHTRDKCSQPRETVEPPKPKSTPVVTFTALDVAYAEVIKQPQQETKKKFKRTMATNKPTTNEPATVSANPPTETTNEIKEIVTACVTTTATYATACASTPCTTNTITQTSTKEEPADQIMKQIALRAVNMMAKYNNTNPPKKIHDLAVVMIHCLNQMEKDSNIEESIDEHGNTITKIS